MPLYVRTPDNVVLRFESKGDLRRWIDQGKVTMDATFLTDDKVWKPLGELLNPGNTGQPSSQPKDVGVQGQEPKVKNDEPAWVPKAKVILPVSDWDDEFDFDEGQPSRRGWYVAGLLFVIAGVAVAAWFLFGEALFGVKGGGVQAQKHAKVIAQSNRVPKSVKKKPAVEPVHRVVVHKVDSHRQPDASGKPAVVTHDAARVAQAPKQTDTPPAKPKQDKPVQAKKQAQLSSKSGRHAIKKTVVSAPKKSKKRPTTVVSQRGQDTYDSHMRMGNRLLLSGDFRRAEGHFQFALNIRPHSVEALTKIGECEVRKGNVKKGIEYFQAALNYNSEYSPAMIKLARLYKRRGNQAQARAWYSKYVEVHPYGLHVQEAKAYLGVK